VERGEVVGGGEAGCEHVFFTLEMFPAQAHSLPILHRLMLNFASFRQFRPGIGERVMRARRAFCERAQFKRAPAIALR
jgi:hypothetical protein